MSELERRIADDDHNAAGRGNPPELRVLGYPGAFTTWGAGFVGQILQNAGHTLAVMQLGQVPPPPPHEEAVRIMVGHGPSMNWLEADAPGQRRTIVFLDAPADAMADLLSGTSDPMEAARFMTGTLAPLARVLREDKVLLLDRAMAADLPAVQGAIVGHLADVLSPPAGPVPDAMPLAPARNLPLGGQALSLARQMLAPFADLATGVAHATIIWPLACFYSGIHPGELAPPIVEVIGPRRILYYGPYFHLPVGPWRADVQMYLARNLPDTEFGVDVVTGTEPVRRRFRPAQDGLAELSVPFVIERAEDRVELRIWLLQGAMEGFIGLRQVLLHPMSSAERRA